MAASFPLQPAAHAATHSDALMARVVAEATHAIVVCACADGSRPIVHVNREFEQLTGFSHASARGRALPALLRPPGGQFEWERVDAVMAGRTPWRKTLPAARRDGTVFWADLHVYPLFNDTAVSHWVGVIADVTDRLELHEALRQSEAQHRLLAENINDLITVYRADGRCIFASTSCRAMLGYEPGDLVGKPLRRIIHPSDRAAARHLFTAHFHGHHDSVLVHRLRRKDGSYLWTETRSKTRFDPATNLPSEIVSTTRDITKRHQAEEHLRAMHELLDAVYEAVPIGLCLLDSLNRIIQCNQAFARLFAIEQNSAPGRLVDTLLPARELSRAAINQGVSCECECTNADGDLFPAELTVVPLDAPGGGHRLVVLNDLRERKKIEARLREASQLESLGTLAGGISHDFNNMLSIVLGYASLLRDATGDPARINHYADTIIDAGKRGADVVRQLQLFASTQDAELVSTDAHALIEQALKHTTASWPANIKVIRSFGAADAIVTADSGQFVQAFQKLLENGRDAMPEGGTLTVRTTDVGQAAFATMGTASEPRNYLRISVEDTGRGMDAATRARMFEPFFDRGNREHTGVGLAIVYGIMRAHRGLIEVDSAPGRGTCVHLLFPRMEARAASRAVLPPEPADEAPERRTILLVEDEQDIGALWLELLPTDGWRVLWAREGNEALRLFRAHRDEIAVVFTDIGLPGVDGWHVADTVRQEDPRMPLLIASGAFHRGDRQRGYAEPVTYLPKPYVPSKVLKQLRALRPA